MVRSHALALVILTTGATACGSAATAPPAVTGGSTSTAACTTFGNRQVVLARTSAVGAFSHAPFRPGDLAIITNGEETNDPRFSYQWIRQRGEAVDVFAPADGVLIRIRRKTANPMFQSDDFDLFFMVACDPRDPENRDTLVRFNHITDPRADIVAAYLGGSQPSQDVLASPVVEFLELQVPRVNIVVKAGERIGSTRGVPGAFGFDYMVAVDNRTVCPFDVLSEPHRSQLLALLGPMSATPAGPPVPGYPCRGYGARP